MCNLALHPAENKDGCLNKNLTFMTNIQQPPKKEYWLSNTAAKSTSHIKPQQCKTKYINKNVYNLMQQWVKNLVTFCLHIEGFWSLCQVVDIQICYVIFMTLKWVLWKIKMKKVEYITQTVPIKIGNIHSFC